jgi:hypothetical protein
MREIVRPVDKEMYIDILHRLPDAVKGKRPEKWRTKCWLFHNDNTPAHRSVLVNDLCAKINVKTPEHSLHLAPADFYLFPLLKSALNRWRFSGSTDIITNEMKELKRLSRKCLQDCFQYICSP